MGYLPMSIGQGDPQSPEMIHVIATAVGCPQELDDRILLLKTSQTLV